MGFLTGPIAVRRFRVAGPAPGAFGPEHLGRLAEYRSGRGGPAAADGSDAGWTAGGSVLDVSFELEKNVWPDALLFDLCVTTDRLPAELMRAYYGAEVKALAANNPSGLPSARQKREAREAARERLEGEARDGRFRRRKCVPVMWDARANEVWFGSPSWPAIDRFAPLFRRTFGLDLEAVTAGRLAADGADGADGAAAPSAFVPGVTPGDVAWVPDGASLDHLGNEFLLWLWFLGDAGADAVRLPDGSEAAFMIARSLALECPRGQTGREVFAHEGPCRLPEARRAAQAGKLPRKAGLTVVRHDSQYEFALAAEAFVLTSGKVPRPEAGAARARGEERLDRVRDLVGTADLLYRAFLSVRLSARWADTLGRMQRWLSREGVAA